MGEREMLELAAKAIGYEVACGGEEFGHRGGVMLVGAPNIWNPLADDGDALRLAVKLGLSIDPRRGGVAVISEDEKVVIIESAITPQDLLPATRLAILRAAAEIGAQQGKGEG